MTCRRITTWGLLAAVIAANPALSHAQHVSPMIYDLGPAGKDAIREVNYWNSQAQATAVEVTVSRRSYDEFGNAIDVPAQDAFQITPGQFLVAAGERQKVRIRYVGPSALSTSATYAVTFRQLPIANTAGDDSKLRMLVDFTSIANVVPPGASADIAITNATRDGDVAVITFVNRGHSYGRLDWQPLLLSDAANTIEFPVEALRDEHDLRWILPNGQRTVRLPLGPDLSGPINARFAPRAAD